MNNIKLTKTELKVLELFIQGKTRSEIANEMFVEKCTIKAHFDNIHKKFDLKTSNGEEKFAIQVKLAIKYLKWKNLDKQNFQSYIDRLETQAIKLTRLLKKVNALARYCLRAEQNKRKENLLQIIKWTN